MKLRKLLLPFSPIYGAIVAIRNRMYDSGKLKSTEFEKPVIVVGNLTTGGTGKTPHTEMLIDLFNAEKIKSAVLSRGYRRNTSELIEVRTDHSAAEVGDEPKQIKLKHSNNVVVVNKDRVKGIEYIFEKHPEIKVVVMDDGYQHRAVKPGLSILLIDHKDVEKKDYLLPEVIYVKAKKGSAEQISLLFQKRLSFSLPWKNAVAGSKSILKNRKKYISPT